MDLLFKILKVSGLVTLILAFAILLAPTLRGPFVVVHFSTALRGYLLAQLAMLNLVLAAIALYSRLLALEQMAMLPEAQNGSGRNSSTQPMRC